MAKIEGFGNQQPSYIAQGLSGNGPGSGYAIKGFESIEYDPPELEVTCEWSKDHENALILRSTAPYTDRRLAYATVGIGGGPATNAELGPNQHIVHLPRADRINGVFAHADDNSATLPVVVRTSDKTYELEVDAKDRQIYAPPVLADVEGITKFFENFEFDGGSLWVSPKYGSSSILRRGDEAQGRYAEIRNVGTAKRLKRTLNVKESLANYPLLHFRYKPTHMTKVTLALGRRSYVKLSEKYGSAKSVRFGSELILDDQWHTWHGLVTDVLDTPSLTSDCFRPGSLSLGSLSKEDQTGRTSHWCLDDLVLGPAVSVSNQLALVPRYFSIDGIRDVRMALSQGAASYDELSTEQRSDLKWRKIANDERSVPSFEGIRDGVCYLFLKAVDSRGTESTVSEFPFLCDREPIEITHSFQSSDDPLENGSVLEFYFATGVGALPVISEAELRWNDELVALEDGELAGSIVRAGHKISALINWPYVFRKQLDAAKDGDEAKITIGNITDGARNEAAPCSVVVKVDYATDTNPPTLLPTRYPKNVFFSTALHGARGLPRELSHDKNTEVELKHDSEREPYIECKLGRKSAYVAFRFGKSSWRVADFPYLSCKVRIPSGTTTNKVTLDMILYTAKKDTYTVRLTGGKLEKDMVALPEPVTWDDGGWHDVSFDVRDILDSAVAAEEKSGKGVSTLRLSLSRVTGDKGAVLQLKDLYLYSDWPKNKKVELRAYDASGIDGMLWREGDGESKDLSFSPGSLASVTSATRWIRLHVRDNAGNLSIPVRIPMMQKAAVAEVTAAIEEK